MLPDIIALAPTAQVPIEMALFTLAIGFFFLYALDKAFFQTRKTNGKESNGRTSRTIGVLSTAEFCSHGFLEGLAIGVSFQYELGLGILVAIAVISHDFCDGLSTLALVLNSGNTLKASMSMLLLDAIAPVLGAVTTLFFFIQDNFIVFASSFLAGSFVYMGAVSLLPEAHRKNRPIVTLIFFLVGFILIFFISRLIKS